MGPCCSRADASRPAGVLWTHRRPAGGLRHRCCQLPGQENPSLRWQMLLQQPWFLPREWCMDGLTLFQQGLAKGMSPASSKLCEESRGTTRPRGNTCTPSCRSGCALGSPLCSDFFPLPSLALSIGVIVKLLYWSSWRCRRRSQLCSLVCSPNSCGDEKCYPHPKGLGCENKENLRCRPGRVTAPCSSAWGLPAAHSAGRLGRPRLLPSLQAPHVSARGIAREPLRGHGWRKWRWRGWRRRRCLPRTRLFSGRPVSLSHPFPYCPHPCCFCPEIAPKWETAGPCHELEGRIIE